MRVKVFLIYDVDIKTGCDIKVVAVRLSMKAARAVAKEAGNRRVERRLATKDETLVDEQALLATLNRRKA